MAAMSTSASVATAAFDQLKRESLRKLRDMEDKSPKGSVDAPIVDMIHMINAHPNYVTSSSCSGRIAVFCGVAATASSEQLPSSDHLITKGGKWLLAEHATVTIEQLRDALQSQADETDAQSNMVIFKHEPFIMHVVCRDLDAAKELLQCGISCGYRESGIVVGNKKIMCAIRTTANAMEIPLGRSTSQLLVDDAYLQWILDIANEKFAANRKKTDQLCAAFRTRFIDRAASAATPIATLKRSPSSVSLRRCRALLDAGNTRLLHRVGHSSVLYKGCVYVFGGQGQTASGTSSRLSDFVIVLSGDKGSADYAVRNMETSGPEPSPRMHHSGVVVGDQMIVFGGRAGPLKCFNDVHVFNFVTSTWSELTIGGEQQPAARWKHSCSVVGTKMYIFGGRDSCNVFQDLFVVDFADEEPTWRKIDIGCESAPAPRFDHVGVPLSGSNQLLVWGGVASLDEASCADDGRRDVCWLFDISNSTWEQRTIKNAEQGPAGGLFGAAACAVDNGAHVVVCGGTATTASVESTKSAPQKIYSLSVATMEWQLMGTIDSSAEHHTRAALVYSTGTWLPERSELLVLGGGFQVFGFGQCYSSSFACEFVVVQKGVMTGKDKTSATAQAGIPAASASISSTEETALDPSRPLGVLTQKTQVKAVKTLLEEAKVYDKTRRVHIVPSREIDGSPAFLLPVLPSISSARAVHEALQALEIIADEDSYANKFGKATGTNRNDVVRLAIVDFAKLHALPDAVVQAIPERYEFVSDVLMVPRGSFLEAEWTPEITKTMWQTVCRTTNPRLSRVARKAFIDPGEKRQSRVELLYVDPETPIQSSRPDEKGWVEVRENGLTYGWDLTKVMFSSGNVTEKARMGKIGCKGDVIVDLFCGIGYYVVPFLVHGGAAFVHACEWNPDSVNALKFNLKRNNVAHKCTIYEGDNQVHAPTIGPIADRVNLGLLPTSEKAWPLAAQVLKPQGGWMHVHDNVAVEDREAWEKRVVESMTKLGEQYGKHWRVTCEHVEKVKSYAPKVHHLVADIKCVAISSEE